MSKEKITTGLINCETCGKEIAKQARVCPHCGIKRSTRGFFKTTLIVLGIFFFFAFMGALRDDSSDIPTCDSAYGIGLAKYSINQKIIERGIDQQTAAWSRGSNASVVNDEVIDIHDAQVVSYDETAKSRSCNGVAETKLTGRVPVSYTFRILNDDTVDVSVSLRK